jgi:hypothetical protein
MARKITHSTFILIGIIKAGRLEACNILVSFLFGLRML